LDESELKTLKDRAEFFGLDKTKDFADYKKKYLNSVKTIEKFSKSGTIESRKIGFQFFANKAISKQNTKQLRKSIASWTEKAELHKAKIANPEKYDAEWDSKADDHKAGLINHWKKELRNFETNIKDAEAEIDKRGQDK